MQLFAPNNFIFIDFPLKYLNSLVVGVNVVHWQRCYLQILQPEKIKYFDFKKGAKERGIIKIFNKDFIILSLYEIK